MGKVKLLLFGVLATILMASTGFAVEESFEAKLTPKDEVSSHKSKATGKAEFKLSEDGQTLIYKLYVENIIDPTAAHIHLGKKGVEGDPVVILPFDDVKKGKFSGLLSEGKITGMDLLGKLQDKPLSALVKHIKSGNTYVNIHSYGNPKGDIRGYIK